VGPGKEVECVGVDARVIFFNSELQITNKIQYPISSTPSIKTIMDNPSFILSDRYLVLAN